MSGSAAGFLRARCRTRYTPSEIPSSQDSLSNRVDRHHRPVPGIREKRILVLRDPVSHIQHVGPVVLVVLVVAAELKVVRHRLREFVLGKCKQAGRLPAVVRDLRVADDLVLCDPCTRCGADVVLGVQTPQRAEVIYNRVAQGSDPDVLLRVMGKFRSPPGTTYSWSGATRAGSDRLSLLEYYIF